MLDIAKILGIVWLLLTIIGILLLKVGDTSKSASYHTWYRISKLVLIVASVIGFASILISLWHNYLGGNYV